MQSRSGKLLANSFFSVLTWLIPIILGLIATPFVLKSLGAESYGVYLVILGFIGYSFTFNIARSVAKYVAEYRGSGSVDKINSAISAAFWLNLSLGIFGAIVIALSAEWLIRDVLQISEQYQKAATFALIVGGISIPVTLVGQVFQSILQGEQSFGVLSLVANLGSFLINAGNITLAVMGYGIDTLIVWMLVVTTLLAALYFVASRRSASDLGVTFGASREMLRPVLVYGSSIYVYQLCGSLLLLFERSLVIRKFGGEAASWYIVPMTLAIYFHGFMSSLLLAVFPMMNELLGDKGRLAMLYEKSTKVLIALMVPFLVTAFFGGRMFLALWIDGKFAENAYWLFVLHAATFSAMVLLIAPWQLNETFNKPAINAWITFLSSSIAIVLMLVTVDRWHEEGVAASRLIGVALTLPVIIYSERRFLSSNGVKGLVLAAIRVLPAAVVLVLAEYALFSLVKPGWISLIIVTFVCTLAYAGMLLLTKFISTDERVILLNALRTKRIAV